MDDRVKTQINLVKAKANQVDLASNGDVDNTLLIKMLNHELIALCKELDRLLDKKNQPNDQEFDFLEFDEMLEAHNKSRGKSTNIDQGSKESNKKKGAGCKDGAGLEIKKKISMLDLSAIQDTAQKKIKIDATQPQKNMLGLTQIQKDVAIRGPTATQKSETEYQKRKAREALKKLEALKVNKKKFGDVLLGKQDDNRIMEWLLEEKILNEDDIAE